MRGLYSRVAALSFAAAAATGCSKESFTFTGVKGSALIMGDKVSETFYQNKAQGQVDILVVDDNSASMGPEQAKLRTKFPQFTQALNQIDYHIGVITTDLESAALSKGDLVQLPNQSKYITSSNGDASQEFSNLISLGTSGSGNEQPLGAAIMAMDKRNAENSGFFREGTDVAILVMSDEDEMSDGTQGTTASQVIDHFHSIWGDTKRLIAFGIIIQSGDAACLQEQAAQGSGGNGYYGTHVADLATQTGGATFSICDNDYSRSLAAISQKVRNLVFSIELSNTPVDGTVQIDISTGEHIPFTVSGRRLIFNHAPQMGARIVVTYNKSKI